MHERRGVTHTHEVAGLLARHVLACKGREGLEHGTVVLPHRVAADAVAGKAPAGLEARKAPQAQVHVHATLDDAKEGLILSGVRGTAALGPQARELDGALDEAPLGWVGRALVELHHDVGTQLLRYAHVVRR